MKKFKKVIVSIAVCCAIVSSMGMAVSAAYDFYFDLGRGLSDTSQAAIKGNTNNSASVLITDSTISNSAYMDFCVLDSDKKVTSNTKKITQPQYTSHFSIDYITTPSRYTTVYLKGSAGYYSVSATGDWTP